MRIFYPYPLRQPLGKTPKNRHHTKKGPGRRHQQGKPKFHPNFFL